MLTNHVWLRYLKDFLMLFYKSPCDVRPMKGHKGLGIILVPEHMNSTARPIGARYDTEMTQSRTMTPTPCLFSSRRTRTIEPTPYALISGICAAATDCPRRRAFSSGMKMSI